MSAKERPEVSDTTDEVKMENFLECGWNQSWFMLYASAYSKTHLWKGSVLYM